MTRPIISTIAILLLFAPNAYSREKPKPNINASKEFPGVFHSPSADATPAVFRSVLQLEVAIKRGDSEARVVVVREGARGSPVALAPIGIRRHRHMARYPLDGIGSREALAWRLSHGHSSELGLHGA